MKRQGVSLVEVLIVIAILAILLAGATVVLVSLLQHTGRQRAAYQGIRTANQFAAALRRDARLATAVQVSEASADVGQQLQLTLPDGSSVHYQVVDRGIDRTARVGEQVTQREFFRLPELERFRFEQAEVANIVCVWSQRWQGPRPIDRDDAPTRNHRIEVAARGEVDDD